MIIARTPFRISFFGGGSDYPEWFNDHGPGQVISATIDRYCYAVVKKCHQFAPNHKYRIVWREVEHPDHVDDIQHPSIREAIKHLRLVEEPLEIHHLADLPSRSGIGSSSAFTVGLLNALTRITDRPWPKQVLARTAINIERDNLGEEVGYQDQIAAAYGGLNHITIENGDWKVNRITRYPALEKELADWCLMVSTGVQRRSDDVVKTYIGNIGQQIPGMQRLMDLTEQALEKLGKEDVYGFASLLNEAWEIKKARGGKITHPTIDRIHQRATEAGAVGAKVMGAGGGGFVLVMAPPSAHTSIKAALSEFQTTNVKFTLTGTEITHDEGSRIRVLQPSSHRARPLPGSGQKVG